MAVRSLCWAKMIKQACVMRTCNILGKSLIFQVRTSQFVCHLVVLFLHFCQHINQLFDAFLKVVTVNILNWSSPELSTSTTEVCEVLSLAHFIQDWGVQIPPSTGRAHTNPLIELTASSNSGHSTGPHCPCPCSLQSARAHPLCMHRDFSEGKSADKQRACGESLASEVCSRNCGISAECWGGGCLDLIGACCWYCSQNSGRGHLYLELVGQLMELHKLLPWLRRDRFDQH